MRRYGKTVWKTMPFLRLLLALITGILWQFYFSTEPPAIYMTALAATCLFPVYRFLSIHNKFRLRWLNGLAIYTLATCTGAAAMYAQNIVHNADWIGHHYRQINAILVTLQEPLVEKKKSFKALAEVEYALTDSWATASGKILLYLKKDSGTAGLQYGSQLITRKPLQEIVNMGNPAAFDYKKYCASKGIYHQVFLKTTDYRLLPALHQNRFTVTLQAAQLFITSTLKENIHGNKEAGVAEALLIGFRNDLDKDLLLAYSNTGVVHIIAISGMHLGMIYGLLIVLLRPLRSRRSYRWLKPLITLLVLWGFSFLAGAGASILRSVVMFSFIVIGEAIGRRTNIFNTLAASAFCLLVYDPYYLWDVGFQLSYAAVLSIVLFMKPIYRCLYFQNKILNSIWQLNAVTLSAQILTLPLLLYYFHQFPNLFLFTNFFIVPLSGIILYGCLVLLAVAKIPVLGSLTGKTISLLITQMNGLVERTAAIPVGITTNIRINLLQCFLLYGCIACFAWWLLQKQTPGLLSGMGLLVLFLFIRCIVLVQ